MMPTMPKPTFEQVYNILASESDRFLAARKVTGLFGHAWEGAPQADVEPDDVGQQHNREQRIRREAYVEALEAEGAIYGEEPSVRAARRYPLRRRVSKVIFDPHDAGEWRFVEHREQTEAQWRCGDAYPEWSHPVGALTVARVRALAALCDDPWTYEEDTSVEGSAT